MPVSKAEPNSKCPSTESIRSIKTTGMSAVAFSEHKVVDSKQSFYITRPFPWYTISL